MGLARMRDETDVVFAVENMYPWRARNREWAAYQPDWDPRNQDYPQVTLDLSHTAVSGTSALEMAGDLGDRLAHIHLADGTGLARDEHLVPGRGNQQCAEVLEGLAQQGFTGTVVARGEHPPGGQPRRAGGRPRRGAGVRPTPSRRAAVVPGVARGPSLTRVSDDPRDGLSRWLARSSPSAATSG